MEGQFSGMIKISTISDYIAPSQACIVNLQGNKIAETSDLPQGEVFIHASRRTDPLLAPVATPPAVKVTLHDCLACSGCITSAETILLEHQSVDELLERLRDPSMTVVVSISPQSRSSIAAHYGLSPLETLSRLVTILKQLGVRHVFDTTCSRDLSLWETSRDFIARYRATHSSSSSSSSSSSASLPLLCSSCPGWVCYAEKTHGDSILPLLSTAKSPQAMMGTLVKRLIGIPPAPSSSSSSSSSLSSTTQLLPPERIYHVAIMPCYDRKLEASRDELTAPPSSSSTTTTSTTSPPLVPETDSVLATAELVLLLDRLGIDIHSTSPTPLDPTTSLLSIDAATGRLASYPGSAGGYLDFVFREAVRELFGTMLPPGPLFRIPGRNVDTFEVVHRVGDEVVLRFVAAYGFRNIQSIVRRIKRGGSRGDEIHFVEVMACPGACLSGGGQIKREEGGRGGMMIDSVPSSSTTTTTTTLSSLDALDYLHHEHPDLVYRSPVDNPTFQSVYAAHFDQGRDEAKRRQWLHTTYRKRDKTVLSSVSDW